jgi:hypothetical protein
MITSNTKYPLGGKVATVETPSFCCMISTAKEGIFQKQSVMFSDVSQGMQSRRHVAKLLYNDILDSNARLGLHDAITAHLDAAGMTGQSLTDALRSLFEGLSAEGVGAGTLLDSL